MSIDLSEEQRQAILRGEHVRVSSSELGQDVVLLAADAFDDLKEAVIDEQEQAVFRAFARKQAARLAQENPY